MAWLGLLLLIVALLALRQNLIVVLGLAVGYAYVVFGDGHVQGIVLDAWDALNREVLLSIPLYILAGNLMTRGDMADRLITVMRLATSPVPGGLAVATVLSCALFAAISGSGTVTLLAVGSVMYPALIKEGYSKRFALGALCAAGTLGIIIPPSIPLILYGVMTQASIADLFIAGLGPAFVLVTLMTIYALVVNRHIDAKPLDKQALWDALLRAVWSLAMPVIILGGIYSGYFTATESAAVAVAYALFVELVIHRELKFEDVFAVVGDTTKLLGSLFPVLMLALSLNIFLTYEQIPDELVAFLTDTVESPTVFLLATNLFLLLVGCMMDIGSAILILAPILSPAANALGIDPIHFGIVMVVNLELGYLTPPLGLNIIVAMTAFKERFWFICSSVVPFLLLMLVGLVLVTFIPWLSTMFL